MTRAEAVLLRRREDREHCLSSRSELRCRRASAETPGTEQPHAGIGAGAAGYAVPHCDGEKGGTKDCITVHSQLNRRRLAEVLLGARNDRGV